MENVIQTTPQIAVPLLYKAAAVSVIAAALTGVGVMTGVIPAKGSTPPDTTPLLDAASIAAMQQEVKRITANDRLCRYIAFICESLRKQGRHRVTHVTLLVGLVPMKDETVVE